MSWSDDEKESFSAYVEEECEWYEEEVHSYILHLTSHLGMMDTHVRKI